MHLITEQFKSHETVLGTSSLDGSVAVNVLLSGTNLPRPVWYGYVKMSVAGTRRSDSLRQLDLTTARISVIIRPANTSNP